MEAKTSKRLNFIINIVYISIILGVAYLFFKYLFWATSPFLLSFFVAVCLQHPLRAIDKKTKGKAHAFWSILLVLLCILIVIIPLSLILWKVGTQVMDFFRYIGSLLKDMPTLLDDIENMLVKLVSNLPEGIASSLNEKIIEFFSEITTGFEFSSFGFDSSSLSTGITTGITGVYSILKNIPSIALAVVIGIISSIFFTKDYKYIVSFISKQLPNNKQNLLVEIKQIFSTTVIKLIKAYSIIMTITFCELAAGFTILRAIGLLDTSYIYVIALVIAVFDILPVAGSGGILIPWALINLVLGNFQLAIGLAIVYVIILIVRQYIEPKIVGDTLGVHPIITLAGLYFGLKLFGFMGMFIVPISIMTIKAFNDTGRIQIWKTIDRN